MKVTVLGSGVCASQMPGTPNRYPPGFLVTWGKDEEHKVLFECSEGIRFRLERAGYDYCDIHHIAISHAHPDHFALPNFLQSVFGRGLYLGKEYQNPEVHVYCPKQIVDDFPLLWRAYNPEWGDEQYWWPKLVFHPMMSEADIAIVSSMVKIGDGNLLAYSVYHGFGKVDALGFRLETPGGTFAYSGDTGLCRELSLLAHDAGILVCEASARIGDDAALRKPRGYGHLNPLAAGILSRNAGVKKLVLFHYTGLDSDEAIIEDCRLSDYKGELVIAKDFEVLEV